MFLSSKYLHWGGLRGAFSQPSTPLGVRYTQKKKINDKKLYVMYVKFSVDIIWDRINVDKANTAVYCNIT